MRAPMAFFLFALSMSLPLACRPAATDAAAGPSQSPGLTARMYVLRKVAGAGLPAVLLDNVHATIVSLADTIWLEPDGTGVEVSTEQSQDKGAAEGPITRTDERPFSYGLDRNRIEIAFECNDVIIRSCSPPPHLMGVLTESGLLLDHALYYRTPLEYERVR